MTDIYVSAGGQVRHFQFDEAAWKRRARCLGRLARAVQWAFLAFATGYVISLAVKGAVIWS